VGTLQHLVRVPTPTRTGVEEHREWFVVYHFGFPFLSCVAGVISRKVRNVRKVVISEIVHNTLDSVFQRWHAKVDDIPKPFVQ
jgi:endonuclease III-like uncharacterized protein